MKAIVFQSMRTLGMNGAQVVFGLLTSIILARALGPAERGAFALAVLIAGSTAMVCNPGIYASANYFLSTQRWTLGQAFGTVVLASGMFGALAGLLAVLVVLLTGLASPLAANRTLILALGVLTTATLISNSLNGLFFGAGKIALITNWKIVFSTLQATLFFALSFHAADATSYCVAFAALATGDALALLLLFRLQLRVRADTSRALFRQLLQYGVPVYGSRLLLFVGQRLDTYIVFFFLGSVVLGHYTIAVTIAEQIWILPLSVSMIMMPNLGRLDPAQAADITATVVRFASALILLGALALALTMPWLLPILYGAAYAPAVLPLLLLLPGTAAISIFNILEPYFQSRGQPHIPFIITIVGVIANLVADLLLIRPYGMAGAASASSFAYGLQLVVMSAAFMRCSHASPRAMFGIGRAYIEIAGYLMRRYTAAATFQPAKHKGPADV